MRVRWAIVALLVIGLLGMFSTSHAATLLPGMDFELEDLTGESVTLTDLLQDSQLLVLSFWCVA